MQSKEARRLTNQRYYQRDPERHLAKRQAWKKRFRAWYVSLKDKPCTDCGGRFHHSAMQFDHIGTDKLANVTELARRYNKSLVLIEIEKCELVCANCHAVRTWSRSAAEA